MSDNVVPPLRGSFWQRLQRQTSTGNYLPEIDGLRFLAVVSVIVFHLVGFIALRSHAPYVQTLAQNRLAEVLRCGERGVPLFFVISGFLLGLPFAAHALRGEKPVVIRDFYLRRLTRLEPPFLVALLLCFLLARAMGRATTGASFGHLFANLFYSHTLIYHKMSAINPVLWSLEIEAQFYLIVPLLARVYSISSPLKRRSLLLCASGIFGIGSLFFAQHSSWLPLTLPFHLPCFLLGMLAADFFLTFQNRPVRSQASSTRLCDLFALVVLIAMFGLPRLAVVDNLLLPFLFATLLLCVLWGDFCRKIASLPLLYTVGGMCYSLYLFHYQIITTLGRFTLRESGSGAFWLDICVQTAVLFPVIVGLCGLFYLTVEKPCMNRNWYRQGLKRLKRRDVASVAPVVIGTDAR